MAAAALSLQQIKSNTSRVFLATKRGNALFLNERFKVEQDPAKSAKYHQLIENLIKITEASKGKDTDKLVSAIVIHLGTIYQVKVDMGAGHPDKAERMKLPPRLILAELRAREIQTDLSIILLIHDYLIAYLRYFSAYGMINIGQRYSSKLFTIAEDADNNITLQLKAEAATTTEAQAFVCKFARYFHPTTYLIYFENITLTDYLALRELSKHPNEDIRQIADSMCRLNLRSASANDFENTSKSLISILLFLGKKLKDDAARPSMQSKSLRSAIAHHCPQLLEAIEAGENGLTPGSITEKSVQEMMITLKDQYGPIIDARAVAMQKYPTLLDELNAMGQKDFAQRKAHFAQYAKPLWPGFSPNLDLTTSFPTLAGLSDWYDSQLRMDVNPRLDKLTKTIDAVYPERNRATGPAPTTLSPHAAAAKESPKRAEGKKSLKDAREHADLAEDISADAFASRYAGAGAGAGAGAEPHENKKGKEKPFSLSAMFQHRRFPEIRYDARVQEWQEMDHVNAGVIKHAFPNSIDLFLGTPYCIQGEWEHPDTGRKCPLYCVLGKIEVHGRCYEGAFQYCFGADDGICYHRFLGPQPGVAFLNALATKTWQRIHYPTLQESLKIPAKAKTITTTLPQFKDMVMEYDPHFGTITYQDGETRITILNP